MPRRTFRSVEIRRLRKSLKAAKKNLAITLAVESEDEEEDDDGSSMSDEEGAYDGDGDDDDMSYDMSSDDNMSYESGSESDSDVDDAILGYMTATYELDDVLSHRYLAPRVSRKSGLNIFEEDLDEGAPYFATPRAFKTKYRCTRKSLEYLTGLIADHPTFARGKRGPQQAPVKHQLMTLLHFMGHEGMTDDQQAVVFRMGVGTSQLYRRRAKTAILTLKKKFVYWPDEEERKEIAERFRVKYDCPNCIGNGDGTLAELAFAPQTPDASDYHGRSYKWSVTIFIVGDDRGFVRYYLSGFPGSAHDNRVWKWSKLYNNQSEFFSELQYILTDSAYVPCQVIVPAFKRTELISTADTANPTLVSKKQNFNNKMSTPREEIEHINGFLKGRWPGAIRKIRSIITEDEETLREILEYIDCAMILHNILHGLKDGDNDDWAEWHDSDDDLSDLDDPDRGDPDEVSPAEQAMHSTIPFGAPNDCRRDRLVNYLWELNKDDDDSMSSSDLDNSGVVEMATDDDEEMVTDDDVEMEDD